MSDMAHLLGAKELQSFVASLFEIYDYAYYTEADRFFCYLAQNILSHPKLM
jgi:hypothetical protein